VDVFPQVIELKNVLKELKINHEQLICLGILCGTDYNPGGVRGLGPKKSLQLVKEKKTKEKIFESVEEDEKLDLNFEWKAIYKEIKNPKINKKAKINFPKIDEKKIKRILLKHDFSEVRIDKQLEKLDELKKKAAQKTLF